MTTPGTEKLRIGLTGGIASGKTVVSDTLAECGATVIDTDVIARDVVAPGSDGLMAVHQQFGNRIMTDNGELDRAALRQIVFADPTARESLEQITHPLIQTACWEQYRSATGPYAVFVVPLLVGSGLRGSMQRILVVDTAEANQLLRLQARDGDDPLAAQRILAAQSSREQRLAIADDIIGNHAGLSELRAAAARMHQFYLELSQN
ncbi:MAG: dephospho-CoA kinase [Pseudomonadota bacterium]